MKEITRKLIKAAQKDIINSTNENTDAITAALTRAQIKEAFNNIEAALDNLGDNYDDDDDEEILHDNLEEAKFACVRASYRK